MFRDRSFNHSLKLLKSFRSSTQNLYIHISTDEMDLKIFAVVSEKNNIRISDSRINIVL